MYPFGFWEPVTAHGLKLTKTPGAQGYYFFLKVVSSETVNFFLPFFLREARTLRPFAEAILSRKPCLFFLFLFEG